MAQENKEKTKRNKEIYEAYKAGETAINLGKKYNVSRWRIYQIIKRAKVLYEN